MAKVTAPLFSVTASGQFAQTLTFDKRGYARKYVIPANPQTAAQIAVRNKMADIQAVLKTMGTTLRADVKAGLGYRWNTLVISELLQNDGAKLTALIAEHDLFAAGNQDDWEDEAPATGLNADDGAMFYSVASALYDVGLRVAGDGFITLPIETNAVTVAGEWEA